MYWWATFNAPEGAKAASSEVQKRDLLSRYGAWVHPVPHIIEATRDSAILRNDIIDRRPTNRWGIGRVTLLGDAAHAMTPNMAQGACQAMEDAAVLANRLSALDDVADAFRDYEARRIPRTAQVVEQSWAIGAIGQGLVEPQHARHLFHLADRDDVLRYRAS